MDGERELREKLRKIEALYAGAKTAGERAAADAAIGRIREKLHSSEKRERSIEMQFSIHDPWSRQLFMALARRYGLTPYRYYRQRRTTVMITAPESFLKGILWPEFQDLNKALTAYLGAVTERIIKAEVHGETGDAEERAEPARIGHG